MKHILVVDDDSSVLDVLTRALVGYRMSIARDPDEALHVASNFGSLDLLITDYHMPQLSGLELCQRLKQDPNTSMIPAIMLTARGYHLEPRDTQESGILRMLSKPFSPRHLLATVNEVLELSRAA